MYIRVPYEEARYNIGAVPIRRVARCMFLPTLLYVSAGSTTEPHQTSIRRTLAIVLQVTLDLGDFAELMCYYSAVLYETYNHNKELETLIMSFLVIVILAAFVASYM